MPFDRARDESIEQQKAALLLHPEKIALADLLRHGSDNLEISINFKVCADCHDFFKVSAGVTHRYAPSWTVNYRRMPSLAAARLLSGGGALPSPIDHIARAQDVARFRRGPLLLRRQLVDGGASTRL